METLLAKSLDRIKKKTGGFILYFPNNEKTEEEEFF